MSGGMNILARRAVQRAVTAGAVIDPVEHFADLVRLHRLAEEITRPPIVEQLDALDQPVRVGDLLFHRLSWSYREWMWRSAGTWWRDRGDLLDLAYAWAFAHARDKSALQAMTDPKHAERVIRAWARDTDANYEAVMAACEWLSRPLREPDPKPDQERPPESDQDELRRSAGPVILTLLTETDKPLDFWLYDVAAEVTDAALERIRTNWDRDQAAMAAAFGKKSYHRSSSWHVEATKRFNAAAVAFCAKYTPAQPVEVMKE